MLGALGLVIFGCAKAHLNASLFWRVRLKPIFLKLIFTLAAAALAVAVTLPSHAHNFEQSDTQTVVHYTSPIADYQTFADEKVGSWRAANDKVGQIGGWRAYAKEAQQPENTPTLAPTDAKPVAKPDPHTGHKP